MFFGSIMILHAYIMSGAGDQERNVSTKPHSDDVGRCRLGTGTGTGTDGNANTPYAGGGFDIFIISVRGLRSFHQ